VSRLIPNYFELLITPLEGSIIQDVGFRPHIVENSVKFDLVTVPINEGDGSVFVQVWGKEPNVWKFIDFLRENKPKKGVKYRVDLLSKSYRVEDKFKVLYFMDSLTLGQIKKGLVFFAQQAMDARNAKKIKVGKYKRR